MEIPDTKRKYSKEEKRQLLANLDIEVEHKVRQFEAWLSDALENFRIHQEGQVSRVPKLVRALTMREFGEKYNGDVQAALRGLQRERMGVGGEPGGAGDIEIDKSTRKRKWVASVEAEAEGSKSFKNARMASPNKKPGSSTGPGTAQRARLIASNRTPGTSRTMGRAPASPSPAKSTRPMTNQTQAHSSRTAFPSKPHPTSNTKPARATRPPSTATFNPHLPKTPGFPSKGTNTNTNGVLPTTARVPRRHESMLSLNGSPLANPYELGLEWFAEGGGDSDSDEFEDGEKAGLEEGERRKRAKSIVVRRDPSFSFQSAPMSNGHSHAHTLQRTTSQSSIFPSSSQSAHPHPSKSHMTTPRAIPTPRIPSTTALVTIPTKDGHLLEFDPLQTSPGTLDALEGITDSAKKQAREEMGRLVQAAVSKWSIA